MEYNEDMVDNYLNLICYCITTLFDSMLNFTSNNILYYKYLDCPRLKDIINYLDNNNTNQLIEKWEENINNKSNIIISSQIHDNIINGELTDISNIREIDINEF